MNLTVRILIGMVAGLVLGTLIHLGASPDSWLQIYLVDGVLDTGGQLFIRSLKVMVVPLVLVSLVCGAASLGSTGRIGPLGAKTLGLYLLTTAIAVSLALVVALIVSPGEGAGEVVKVVYEAKPPPSFKDTLLNIFPTNPVEAMAEGQMLQVIVFALLLGVAISRSGAAGTRIRTAFEAANEVVMSLVKMLILLAPYGVFCLMGKLFATVGFEQIGKLLAYFLTVAGVLVLHFLLTYSTLLTLLARVNPITYFKKMREPMLVAFSTSSSGATLPVTLRTVEHRVGVKNEVASFVVPLGATINMDGTAIMQGVATVFIAQFYGIDLNATQYLMVVVTATMASIGTAAVPGVGLVMLTMVLAQVGLPVEGIGLIIGVDRLLDMMRTSVNITGDGTVALIVAKSEGRFDEAIFADPDAGRVVEN